MAVTHAVLELARRPIALCVSGINYGENIGGAIGVSGTVGAAFEADAHGIPAIAAAITAQISEWRTFGTVDWTAARHFTRLLARQVLADGMPAGVSVLNLNVPAQRHHPHRAAQDGAGPAALLRPASARIRPGRSTSRTSSPSRSSSTGTAWSPARTFTPSSATRWPRSPR